MERKVIDDTSAQMIYEMADLIKKLGFDGIAQHVVRSVKNPGMREESLQQLKDINSHFSKSDAIPILRVVMDKFSITKDEI